MTNLEKYKKAFIDTFSLVDEDVSKSKYNETKNWDSVGHINLITTLEEEFDIIFETDDIIDFDSYDRGKEILREKYDVEF